MQINQLNINSIPRKSFTKVNCWKCGKPGHIQRNCRIKSQVNPVSANNYRECTQSTNQESRSHYVPESSAPRFKLSSPHPNFRAGNRSYRPSPSRKHPHSGGNRSSSRDTASEDASSPGPHRRRTRRQQTPQNPGQGSIHNCTVSNYDDCSDDESCDSM